MRATSPSNGKKMAATSDEEMESLARLFDELYKEYNDVMFETQSLKAKWTTEVKRCEALEIICIELRKDKECLTKSHNEVLHEVAGQLEYRPKYQGLLEQLNMMKQQILIKEKEHEKLMEGLKERHEVEIRELQMQIRYCQNQLSVKEAAIAQLELELADSEARIDILNTSLDLAEHNAESKYQCEIQVLRDNLQIELEEKNKLLKELENAEHASLMNKRKYEEQLRDSSSNRHLDMFKHKLMKLRKENEELKRQLHLTK